MGLDMYLRYRKSVSGYDLTGNDPQLYRDIISIAGMEQAADSTSPYVTVEATAIYWRKANAIHGWFVNELGGGVDECQEIHVPREKLVELRNLCFEALSIPANMTLQDHAPSILPPTEGFFFGSGEVDEWYVKDLEYTMENIDRLIAALPEDGEGWDWSLIYQASW